MGALANKHWGRKCRAICNGNWVGFSFTAPPLMLLKKFDFEVKPEELLSAQRQNKHFAVITFLPCAEGTWHSRYQHCCSGTVLCLESSAQHTMNGGFKFLCSKILAKETAIPVFPFLCVPS